jgi:hypothetical protein
LNGGSTTLRCRCASMRKASSNARLQRCCVEPALGLSARPCAATCRHCVRQTCRWACCSAACCSRLLWTCCRQRCGQHTRRPCLPGSTWSTCSRACCGRRCWQPAHSFRTAQQRHVSLLVLTWLLSLLASPWSVLRQGACRTC